jgi:hypothetical protein
LTDIVNVGAGLLAGWGEGVDRGLIIGNKLLFYCELYFIHSTFFNGYQ